MQELPLEHGRDTGAEMFVPALLPEIKGKTG